MTDKNVSLTISVDVIGYDIAFSKNNSTARMRVRKLSDGSWYFGSMNGNNETVDIALFTTIIFLINSGETLFSTKGVPDFALKTLDLISLGQKHKKPNRIILNKNTLKLLKHRITENMAEDRPDSFVSPSVSENYRVLNSVKKRESSRVLRDEALNFYTTWETSAATTAPENDFTEEE